MTTNNDKTLNDILAYLYDKITIEQLAKKTGMDKELLKQLQDKNSLTTANTIIEKMCTDVTQNQAEEVPQKILDIFYFIKDLSQSQIKFQPTDLEDIVGVKLYIENSLGTLLFRIDGVLKAIEEEKLQHDLTELGEKIEPALHNIREVVEELKKTLPQHILYLQLNYKLNNDFKRHLLIGLSALLISIVCFGLSAVFPLAAIGGVAMLVVAIGTLRKSYVEYETSNMLLKKAYGAEISMWDRMRSIVKAAITGMVIMPVSPPSPRLGRPG